MTIQCPCCSHEFEAQEWDDGVCPECDNAYEWDEYCTPDYEECWIEINWASYTPKTQ